MVHRSYFDDTLGLSAGAREAFARDGVIVLADFVPAAQCDGLRQRALELVATHAPTASGTVFSTLDNRHARDAYFEQSANGIGVFYEEGAIDADGNLCVPLEQAVNKIGHAMHDLDPVFNSFSRGKRLQAVADGIGLADPRLVQPMYIFKQPGIGGEKALDISADADRGNGCLGGLPGEHRKGLRTIYRKHDDGQLKMDTIRPDLAWDMSRLEWLEVRKGALIVFNGEFPHLSEPNRSAHSRHAYTLHAVSGSAHYPAGNWIQRPETAGMPFSGFI